MGSAGVSCTRLLLSTSDLAAVDLPVELRGSSESISAIAALLPLESPQSLLVTPRDNVTPKDVVLSELLNDRPPAAWVVASPSDDGDASQAEALQRLALQCITHGLVLVLTTKQTFDLVLVPRQAAMEDGVAFVIFATRLEGVRFISQTIAAKKVAVVLDLDSTLLESEHLPVLPPDWQKLAWQPIGLRQEPSGQAVAGRVCRLPDEPHHCEEVHAASWVWKGASHNYRVRQRLGWSHLRDLLIQESHASGKLSTSVLSLGRPLYVQTCWQILDPHGLIIARHEYNTKINSARPDGMYCIPEKSPCIGVGLRTVFDPDLNMRLGPVWVADDIPEVFMEKYREAVFPVPAYKPVANLPRDYDADGSVLRGMASCIMQFWSHCYGADGKGGAVAAAADAARRTLERLSCVPLGAGAAAADWCAPLFQGHGELGAALSVRAFLERQQQTSDAVPMPATEAAAPFVPENDENALPPKAPGSAAAAPHARVLRPSSRQDNLLAPPAPHLPGKACAAQPGAAAQAAVEPAAAPQADAMQVEDACRGSPGPFTASVSIVPGSPGGADGDVQRLVLLLASAATQELAAEAAGPAALLQGTRGAGGSPAADGCCGGEGLRACPVEPAVVAVVGGSTEVEDAELVGLPAEGVDESGLTGRKRDFAAIAGQDSLLGPAVPGPMAAPELRC